MSVDKAASRVRGAIRQADAELVARHPWLGRDEAMAVGFFLLAWSGIAATAAGWFAGGLPTWAAILLIAWCTSILHEMEHDMIHDLYLGRPGLRGPILGSIWLAKASLDPWKRGRLHLWHHAVSGQEEDFEERLIGLGMPWGVKRLALTFFPPLSATMLRDFARITRARVAAGGRRPDLDTPELGWVRKPINGILLTLPLTTLIGLGLGVPGAWPVLVLWVLPNMLRHAAIVTMSANSHYVGIPRGSLVTQNQILDHWIFWPLQILCWNFGATHGMHHFYVRQPFWRRTLVFGQVRQQMIDNGVRANDLGSFRRANRHAIQ